MSLTAPMAFSSCIKSIHSTLDMAFGLAFSRCKVFFAPSVSLSAISCFSPERRSEKSTDGPSGFTPAGLYFPHSEVGIPVLLTM